MFENIGWLLYIYTRLDALNALCWVFLVAGVINSIGMSLFWAYYLDMDYKGVAKQWSIRTKKSAVVVALLSSCMAILPTKQDALLIYGVTTGVAVAEKTIEAANKSEIVGKVLQIVEAKIDKELKEVKEKK